MNDQEKQEMKKLLESMRNDVLSNIKNLKDVDSSDFIFEEDGDLPGISYHMADMGTDTNDQERHYLILQKEYEFLYDVDQALEKLKDDKYGFCEICNKPILFNRLQAIPFTSHCVECKNRLEKYNKSENNGKAKFKKPYIVDELEEEFGFIDW